MFEQSIIAGAPKKRRIWTACLAVVGQAAAIGAAVLIPLIVFDQLPAARLKPLLAAPEPPRGRPKVEPGGVKHVKVADVQWQIRKGQLVEPASMPPRARMIVDPAPPQYFGDGTGPGIVGGIEGLGLRTDSVVGSVLTSTLKAVEPPPPAPVVTPAKAKPERITLGGNVVEAKLIDRVVPRYPALARQTRIEGAVRLRAVIHVREEFRRSA